MQKQRKPLANIFDWLTEITLYKRPPSTFTEKEWSLYSGWLVNKFISMNPYYIELANYLQKFNPQEKERHYEMYRELVPKRKVWLKYIKSSNKQNKKLAEQISKYFEVPTTQAYEYIKLLGKENCKKILEEMGFEKKEITKLWAGK